MMRSSPELGHDLAVGGPGGGEVLALFFELEAQVDDLLFKVGDLLAEGLGVGGGAEPGLALCLVPSASDRRFSSWRTRTFSRTQRSWAASRSACSEAQVTAGLAVPPLAGGAASRAWILPSRSRWR